MNPRSFDSQPNEFVTLNLPVFGVVDSNSDVNKVSYPIPCNDDSIILLLFFVLLFTNQCIDINLRCKIKLLEVA